jgi:IclR family acetate operon transcriptional repressor
MEAQKASDTVQSVERAFALLELIAASGSGSGTLTELAAMVNLPAPTVHRLLKTLVKMGYARQLPGRGYVLGMRLRSLGDRVDHQFANAAKPHLQFLAQQIGESANLALLDSDMVVYIAQAPSPHAMRMFTEVGMRAYAHSTGVGKAMLSTLPSEQARKIVERSGMPARTGHTIVTWEDLSRELDSIRERGYAVDEEEQEEGVRCYAVPVHGLPVPMAMSISGPVFRVTRQLREAVVPQLQRQAAALAGELLSSGQGVNRHKPSDACSAPTPELGPATRLVTDPAAT